MVAWTVRSTGGGPSAHPHCSLQRWINSAQLAVHFTRADDKRLRWGSGRQRCLFRGAAKSETAEKARRMLESEEPHTCPLPRLVITSGPLFLMNFMPRGRAQNVTGIYLVNPPPTQVCRIHQIVPSYESEIRNSRRCMASTAFVGLQP